MITTKDEKLKTAKEAAKLASQMHKASDDRFNSLEASGWKVARKPMGSGGIGQVVEMSDHFRVQFTYGVTRHNYAYCIIVEK